VSVTVEASSISYDGNDIADEFAVPFKFLETDDLLVRTTDDDGATYTTLVEGVDYTVDGEGDDDGGTVTTTDPVATGTSISIERNTDITQESDFAPQGAFPTARHENAFDKLTLVCQELDRRIAVLEALGDLVDVTELADAVRIGPTALNTGDVVEDSFPFDIACVGGASAEFILWRVVGDAGVFIEGPVVDWEAGADVITVLGITGLLPNQTYALKGLVFFEP
jgi:hypothetical protein